MGEQRASLGVSARVRGLDHRDWEGPTLFQFTCLPKHISHWLQVLQPMFRHRHHLFFCWLLVCQAV